MQLEYFTNAGPDSEPNQNDAALGTLTATELTSGNMIVDLHGMTFEGVATLVERLQDYLTQAAQQVH